MYYWHFLYFHFKQCLKPFKKWGEQEAGISVLMQQKLRKKKEGEKKHFCSFLFYRPWVFHPSYSEQMLRDQGPTDVEKYNLKNGHESLLEAILLCHKNNEFSPSPVKGHDIYGRS